MRLVWGRVEKNDKYTDRWSDELCLSVFFRFVDSAQKNSHFIMQCVEYQID